MFRHIVVFRVHANVTDSQLTDAVTELRAVGGLPGIASWRVESSVDTRKGRIVVEDATFTDADAFAVFRAHSRHVAAGATWRAISDWTVGDYES